MDAFRSMIFTPGNRPEMVAKALASSADAVIVDLEDAVPLDAKSAARDGLTEMIGTADVPVFVRVNGAETDFLFDDVVAVGRSPAVGVVLPKAEDPDLLHRIDGALTAIEISAGRDIGATTIVPLIESAKGAQFAFEILTASPRVRSVLFGSGEQGDLVADLGCEWTPEGTGLIYARSRVVMAARAAGIEHPMDAVFMDFRNLAALRTECELARTVGYVGKVAIHPAQLEVIHDVFTPSPTEVEEKQKIIEAFDNAVTAGSASISVDGRMVDYAVVRQARAVLARAEAAERAARRHQS